jgi:hypothetical protein
MRISSAWAIYLNATPRGPRIPTGAKAGMKLNSLAARIQKFNFRHGNRTRSTLPLPSNPEHFPFGTAVRILER